MHRRSHSREYLSLVRHNGQYLLVRKKYNNENRDEIATYVVVDRSGISQPDPRGATVTTSPPKMSRDSHFRIILELFIEMSHAYSSLCEKHVPLMFFLSNRDKRSMQECPTPSPQTMLGPQKNQKHSVLLFPVQHWLFLLLFSIRSNEQAFVQK